MKLKIAIAAWFLAAAFLTPAQATPVLFNATTTLPAAGNYSQGASTGLQINLTDTYGSAGYILAFGFDGLFNGSPTPPSTSLPPTTPATPIALTVQPDLSGAEGLGDHNTTAHDVDDGFIAPTDGVVLDFANVTQTISNSSVTGATPNQITFNLYQDYNGADYEVYGLTSAPSTLNTSGATWALVQSGAINAPGTLNVQTSSMYTYYAIGVTDCAIDIEGVTVQYSGTTTTSPPVPEPGTFAMAGSALLGLGFTMWKRRRAVTVSER